MTSKAFTLSTFIPSITSVTKTSKVVPRTTSAYGRAYSAAATTGRSRVQPQTWVSRTSIMGLALIVLGLGFYIYTINASVSKGYELKKEQAAIEELLETQKRLVVQQAALGSIVKVNDVAATSGMVPVSGEEFLTANQLSAR